MLGFAHQPVLELIHYAMQAVSEVKNSFPQEMEHLEAPVFLTS